MSDVIRIENCRVMQEVNSPSTYRGGGVIETVIYPLHVAGAARASVALKQNGWELIGGCSNTLIADGVLNTPVVSTKRLKGVLNCVNNLYVYAGEKLPKVCSIAAEYALSGLEELSGIPGSIGGGVIMNCGCFGRDMSQVVEYVDIAIDGVVERLYSCDIDWGYRHSGLEKRGIVVGVMLKLSHSSTDQVKKVMAVYKARRAHQPKRPSLGSTFKQVDGVSAGYYIEQAGLKGLALGGAQISPQHAGFIINTGGGTASDYLGLVSKAKKAVKDKFGVELEEEIKFISNRQTKYSTQQA